MKTYIFDEKKLDETIAKWVEDAIATGHPKAIKNAPLVGKELKEILNSNPKLYKENLRAEPPSKAVKLSVEVAPPEKKQPERESGDNLTIDEMLSGFYSGQ